MIRPADPARRAFRRAVALAVAPLALWPALTVAQGYAQPVVQPLPDPATLQLNESLRALARDPRSFTALLAAAEASLALDDLEASAGFVQRAEAIAPADGRVKAARAALLVRQHRPVEALRLFAEAEQVGALAVSHIGERGLAYDLVGDNTRAQQDYATALAAGADPVITRRLALSQAIAGDQRASEATLLPLLQRSDLAAYRARAFALAIVGKSDEAVSIAETMLPARLSSRMAPYLRYMPRLTRAQQAAAANLGVFPQAAQIGRDDPALAAYAPQAGARPTGRTADARLVPSGEPLGSRSTPREDAAATTTGVGSTASPPPVPITTDPAPQMVLAAAEQPLPPSAPPQATVVAELAPSAADQAPRPSISIAEQPAPPATSQPEVDISLAEAFADFSLPSGPTVPAAGAVDITRIQPRREAPRVSPATATAAKPAAPPKPVHPSRHWVQVGIGRDTKALAFDWRRIKKEAGGLLDRPGPHVAVWGQTNRLVAGPFASAREADALVTRLKEKKIDSLRFTSAQGEEVKPLS